MIKIKLSQSVLWPVVVLVIALLAFYFKPWQAKTLETISVTAEGRAEVAPDIAEFTANVSTNNQNLDTARSQNEQKISSIVIKLKELGIGEKDIKTENISGGRGYEVQTMIYPAPPRPNTNTFSTTLSVKVRDFGLADETLAVFTAGGAENIYGPSLTLSDEAKEEAKSKAREAAVAEAKKKAEELAKLSNRKIGKATSIKESGEPIYPMPVAALSEADLKEKASQIEPGSTTVTVNLAVDFALK